MSEQKEIAVMYYDLCNELDKVLVGQEKAKRAIAASLLCCNCRLLFSGYSGLGKTLMGNVLRNSLNSVRISMIADLNPSEIQKIILHSKNLQLLYMDEFNRVSGKSLSGLNEILEENQITIDNQVYSFPNLYVFASQNNNEIAGIFTVPHAIYDRFDMEISFEKMEKEERDTVIFDDFTPDKQINLDWEKLEYAHQIVKLCTIDSKSRKQFSDFFDIMDTLQLNKEYLFLGENIRAHKFALKLAKVMAMADGRTFIQLSDIAEFISYIYMHRVNQIKTVSESSQKAVQQKFMDLEDKILARKRRIQIFDLKRK